MLDVPRHVRWKFVVFFLTTCIVSGDSKHWYQQVVARLSVANRAILDKILRDNSILKQASAMLATRATKFLTEQSPPPLGCCRYEDFGFIYIFCYKAWTTLIGMRKSLHVKKNMIFANICAPGLGVRDEDLKTLEKSNGAAAERFSDISRGHGNRIDKSHTAHFRLTSRSHKKWLFISI